MLAKSVTRGVDVYIVKAREGSEGAYSARSLAHGVLVPFAVKHGIDLGASGREPLNNQPYFRIERVTHDSPIHGSARAAFNALLDLLGDIAKIQTEEGARTVLRTYLHVRSIVKRSVSIARDAAIVSPGELAGLIRAFVEAASEGGKRAQSCVAGLLDVYAGHDAVDMDRVNAPDKHAPGDVSIRSRIVKDAWDKAFEVRDKPIAESDLMFFARKVAAAKCTEAVVVAVAPNQERFSISEAVKWAREHDVQLSVFWGWESLVAQVMLWSDNARNRALTAVPGAILTRLQGLEVSDAGIDKWKTYFEK